jgi:RsiW-degrading membrane proteinase PrsW (M82 family)
VALLSHPDYDRLLMGSPLRRRGACLAVGTALVVILAIATRIQLGLLANLRADIAAVFYIALAASAALAVVPVTILWFLDRRERETPWLFAAALFWGALIATALALPFNTAFSAAVDAWVAQHPMVAEVLGPDAAKMISAPISAPIVEELTKALGVLALFWLLRAEFDNMRDGFVYGALVGLGFTWFEAPLYVTQGYAEFGVAPWGMQLGWRYALFGFGGRDVHRHLRRVSDSRCRRGVAGSRSRARPPAQHRGPFRQRAAPLRACRRRAGGPAAGVRGPPDLIRRGVPTGSLVWRSFCRSY